MSALTGNRHTARRDGSTMQHTVASSVHIYAGALLEVDGKHVRPARKGSDKTYLGIAGHEADNTGGTAGAIKVVVSYQAAFKLAVTGTATLGVSAYVADDQTVTTVSAAATKVGKIIDLDDDGDVWVLIN